MTNARQIDRPLFSIITVTLNSAQLLRETIESVSAQHCDDFQYIVVDGASKDNTAELLKEYDDTLDIVVSEPDDGVYHAMNKALELASGQYVYFLNAGDVLLHNKVLSLVAEALSRQTPSIFVGSGIRCSKETGKLIFLEYENATFDLEFFRQRTINHQCLFARRELFEPRCFDTRYKMLADYHWLISQLMTDRVSIEYQNIGIVRYLNEGFSNQNYDMFLDEKERILSEFSCISGSNQEELELGRSLSPPVKKSPLLHRLKRVFFRAKD